MLIYLFWYLVRYRRNCLKGTLICLMLKSPMMQWLNSSLRLWKCLLLSFVWNFQAATTLLASDTCITLAGFYRQREVVHASDWIKSLFYIPYCIKWLSPCWAVYYIASYDKGVSATFIYLLRDVPKLALYEQSHLTVARKWHVLNLALVVLQWFLQPKFLPPPPRVHDNTCTCIYDLSPW